MGGGVIGGDMNEEASGGSSLPPQSQIAPSSKTSSTGGWLIGFFVFLTASMLLWVLGAGAHTKFGKWGLIVVSELVAAGAGISMTKVCAGSQPRPRVKEQDRETDLTKNIQATGQAGASKISGILRKVKKTSSLGPDFFASRAGPLTERLLETQAALDRKKKAAIERAPLVEGETRAQQAGKPKIDERLRQPEYAIGQGLISQSELNDMRNTYLAQSELSLGLILPLLLLIFAVAYSLNFDRRQWWISILIVIASFVLSLLAIERRQKYRIELGLLIVSRWDKQLAAEKETKPKPIPEDALRKVLKEELKQLHLEVKPLVVEVHQKPEGSDDKKDKP